jgi:hypothetical protein
MRLDIESLAKSTDKHEFENCIEYLVIAKRFDKVKEYIDRVNEIWSIQLELLPDAMHYAYMDLFIDSETGNYLTEPEN